MTVDSFFEVRREITDQDKVTECRSRVFGTVKRGGERHLVIGVDIGVMEHDRRPGILPIISLSNLAQPHRWCPLLGYQPIEALCRQSADGRAVIIEGIECAEGAGHA